jgi:hypothetical protein
LIVIADKNDCDYEIYGESLHILYELLDEIPQSVTKLEIPLYDKWYHGNTDIFEREASFATELIEFPNLKFNNIIFNGSSENFRTTIKRAYDIINNYIFPNNDMRSKKNEDRVGWIDMVQDVLIMEQNV